MKYKILISLLAILLITTESCTDLEEQYAGHLTAAQIKSENIENLIGGLNASMKNVFQQSFGEVISLSEITTDELIAPTRGPNWSDNGIWRQLHQHQWNADHKLITGCFNDLGVVVFEATNILQFNPSPQQEAKVRFYRAWAMYWMLDFFDQVPYRDPGESTVQPARVRKGLAALDYITSEINDVMTILPEGPASEPNKNAAKVFLMKCYLNKHIYADRQSKTADPTDMNKVISLGDEVLNSNLYEFSDNYFDNFAPDNAVIARENIFTQTNIGVADDNPLFFYTAIPRHYTMIIGFNGFAVLSSLYDKFEETDLRREQVYPTPEWMPNPGNHINIGLLIGQQYNMFSGEPLVDGKGNLVIFTRDVKIIESGADLETTGIRPQKYAFDFSNNVAFNNDWVYLRLPDVLLMKAEAILRGGTATAGPYGNTALELVNSIRLHPSRDASALTSVNFNTLLDERARELWLECWRRQDLIRFGKFLDPFLEKDYTSDPKYLLFPIPNQQIAVNKYLVQNPGY